jgi:hypothetical protein
MAVIGGSDPLGSPPLSVKLLGLVRTTRRGFVAGVNAKERLEL